LIFKLVNRENGSRKVKMKTRLGFVSNSSSSSFLVASDSKKLTITVDISHLVEKVITTIPELHQHYIDDYGESEFHEEHIQERIREAEKYIRKGKKLLVITGSDQDGDPISDMICHAGLENFQVQPKIVVLDGEAGY
jgi:hypothetical protein